MVGALLGALELIEKEPERVERLWENTRYFKRELARLGYDTLGSQTPITPVLFGEAPLAFEASRLLLEEGVFAVGIGFPTVPRGRRGSATSSPPPTRRRCWTRPSGLREGGQEARYNPLRCSFLLPYPLRPPGEAWAE